MIRSRLWPVVGLFAALAIVPSIQAQADDVFLTDGDAFDSSSFNTAGNWSNGQPPSAENDYFTGAFNLRTPADGESYTFAGDSLTVSSLAEDTTDPIWSPQDVMPGERVGFEGGMSGFWYKGTGTEGIITIDNLILDGGVVVHLNGPPDVFNLDGNVTVTDDSYIYAQQGPINVMAPVHGSHSITNPHADDPGVTILSFLSPDSTFNGDLVNHGSFALADDAVMNFTIGAAGVNNSISGVGTTNLNGNFVFDLSGASMTEGDSWSIVTAENAAYGETFQVEGFTEVGQGIWQQGTFQFNQASGELAVAPEIQVLTLRVFTDTGEVSIVNDTEDATFDLNYYELRSDSGSLDLAGWTSIDGDAPLSETSWEKAGGSSANLIAETNLFGMETLAPNDSVSLGQAFAGTQPEDQDLEFLFSTTEDSETLLLGSVEFVTSVGIPGDFNGDNVVDGADFLAWQRGESPNPMSSSDLADWQASYGLSNGLSAVPEPATFSLLGMMALAFLCARGRKQI